VYKGRGTLSLLFPSPLGGEGTDEGEREEAPFTLTLRLRRTGLSATETLADLRHRGEREERRRGEGNKYERCSVDSYYNFRERISDEKDRSNMHHTCKVWF